MADEIFFDGVRFVPLDAAAKSAGRTRDYLMRQCRDGAIRARRVGKSWYVEPASLEAFVVKQDEARAEHYRENARKRAAEYGAQAGMTPAHVAASAASLPKYFSLKDAAARAGLTGEYLAAQCRSGKLPAKRVGDTWYLESSPFYDYVLTREHTRALRYQTMSHARAEERRAHQSPAPSSSAEYATPFATIVETTSALLLAVLIAFGSYTAMSPNGARTLVADMQRTFLTAPEQIQIAAANTAAGGPMSAAQSLARSWNRAVDALIYGVMFPPRMLADSGPKAAVGVKIVSGERSSVQTAAAATSTSPTPVRAVYAPPVRQTVSQTIVNNPVIERVIEKQRVVIEGGLTEEMLNTKLSQLDNSLSSKMYTLTSANSTAISDTYHAVTLTNRIDELAGVDVSGSSFANGSIASSDITGGTIKDASISDSSIEATTLSSSGLTSLATTTVTGDLTVTGDQTIVGTLTIPGAITISSSTISLLTSTFATTSYISAIEASTTRLSWINATGTDAFITNLTAYTSVNAPSFTATSTAATSTFAGGMLLTRAPSIPHAFSSWSIGAAQTNPFDASLVINPATATGDSNLIAAMVNGSIKFLVDSEGDTFVNNLTSVGSVTLSTTTASTFAVEGNTTFGDSLSDITTINGTLVVTGTTTASTVQGNFGIGTTSPYARLSIAGVAGATTDLLSISTSTAAYATTTALTLDANGNLSLLNGAGLTVSGTGTSTFAGYIDVNGTNGTSTVASNLWVKGTLRTGTGSLYLNDSSITAANGGFQFNTAATSTLAVNGFAIGTDKFVVQQTSGNVGIGTASPSALLTVNGTFSAGNATTTNLYSTTASSTNLYATNLSAGATALTSLTLGTALPVSSGGTGVTTSTGSGSVVLSTSPSLTTPALGVASATSINKVAITAPATAATLTISDGGSLITSGGHSLTLTTSGATNVTLPTSGTLYGSGNDPLDTIAEWQTLCTNCADIVNDTTGTLTVLRGGTGATDAATARTNLGVPSTGGTGATGTWGISISGTAAAASSVNFNGGLTTASSPTFGGLNLNGSLTFNQGASTRNVGIVGTYSPNSLAAIWAMGSSYVLGADGTAGTLYGLSYSYEPDYGGAGNNPGAKAGLGHQMQWRANGTTQTAIGTGIWTSGGLTANGTINTGAGSVVQNTGSYIYPGSVSGLTNGQTSYYLASHATWGLYTNTSFDANGGLYDVGNRVCSAAIGTCAVNISGTAAAASSVNFNGGLTTGSSPTFAALTLNGTLTFGVANPTISASSYFIAPGGAYFNSGTVYLEAALQARGGISNDSANCGGDVCLNETFRAPFWYDSSDTAYYVDPNSTSRVYYLTRQRAFGDTEYDVNNTAYYVDPNSISVFNDLRAQIIYDQTDTAYYVDPNSTSRMYNIARQRGYGDIEYDIDDTTYYINPNSNSRVYGLYTQDTYSYACGCWLSALSDERAKQDIQDLPEADGLELIAQLRPVTFNWRDLDRQEQGESRIGFIAQDVERVLPDVVHTSDSSRDMRTENGTTTIANPKTVKYDRLTVPIIKALQQLNLRFENIASTTVESTPDSQAFADSFFSNLFARIGGWLGDSANGLESFFAKDITATNITAETANIRDLTAQTATVGRFCMGSVCLSQDQFVAIVSLTATSTVASTTPASEEIANSIMDRLAARIGEWLANAGNGIVDIFAKNIRAENVYADTVNAKKLCLDDVCVTKVELQALLAGQTAAAGSASGGASTTLSVATSTTDTMPPVITINGLNPATLNVGDTYNDLGALVTDDTDENLGYSVFVDGATSTPNSISLDTAAVGTHTIVYSATDQAGNTGTATRLVNVVSPVGASAEDPSEDTSAESATVSASTTPAGI